jgi:hypothetical protein
LQAKIRGYLSPVSHASLLRICAGYYKINLVDELRMIRTQMGNKIDQKWSQCMGRFVRYHPVKQTVTVTFKFIYFVLRIMLFSALDAQFVDVTIKLYNS